MPSQTSHLLQDITGMGFNMGDPVLRPSSPEERIARKTLFNPLHPNIGRLPVQLI